MKTYIIHVKTAYDREKHMMNQLQSKKIVDYEFVVEGDISDISERELKRLFTSEEVTSTESCSYKHYLTYKKIIEEKQKYALVLEDDIYLENNFNKVLSKIENEIKESQIKNFFISLEDSNLKYVKRSQREKGKYLYPNNSGRLAGAYIISFESALNIVKEMEENKCHMPIDWYHNYCSDKDLINIYWSHPTIAIQGSLMGKIKSLIVEKKYGDLRVLSFHLQRAYKKIIYFFR